MSAAYGEGARRFRWGLAAIAAGAAVVRLGVYFRYYRGTQFGFNDAPYYSRTPSRWRTGGGSSTPPGGRRPTRHHAAARPVSWIDTPEDWQRLVTVVTGVAAVVVIGLVGRRLGGDRVGWWGRPGRPVPGAVAQRRPGDVGEPGRPRRRWMLAALVWQARPTPVWAAVMGVAAGVAALRGPSWAC